MKNISLSGVAKNFRKGGDITRKIHQRSPTYFSHLPTSALFLLKVEKGERARNNGLLPPHITGFFCSFVRSINSSINIIFTSAHQLKKLKC